MLSRENRVILGSLALFFLVAIVIGALENALGLDLQGQPLVIYLLLVTLLAALPQLLLAATDDEVPARTRIRFVVAVTALFAAISVDSVDTGALFAGDLETLQRAAILTIGGGSVVALLCYEFVAGYRSAAAESSLRAPHSR